MIYTVEWMDKSGGQIWVQENLVRSLPPAMATDPDADTYLCHVGHKSYPVTLRYEWKDNDSGEVKDGGTMTWRGTTFQNLKLGEGCKLELLWTANGVTADLCMKTKGVADLTVGNQTFHCQMPR